MLVLGTLASGVTAMGCGGADDELDSGPEVGSAAQAVLIESCDGADTTTGLGHRWTFDEPSGGTAIDAAGTSNGTLGSSALRWPSFDGSGGIALQPTAECDLQAEVDFGNAPGAFGTGDFTVSFWIATKFSGAGLGDLIGNRVAASRGNFLSGRLGASGRPGLEVDDNAHLAAITSSATINDGNWHNVVYVRSGTSLSFYVDGALTGSTTAVAANVLGSAPFKIGRSLPCLAGFRSIAALYDDVRTYDRALGACDVAALTGANAGTPAMFPGATGDACETNAECASGFCVDGACCGDCVDLCPGVVCTPIDACHAAGVCNPATGLCGPGASLADTTTGLDHLWTFDESSGSTAIDSAGASNGALGSSALRWPSFDGSGAIALNPTGTCDLQAEVDFGNAPGAFGTADFTVSFWMATNFSGAGQGDLIGNRVVGSHGNFLSGRLLANGRSTVELDDNNVNYAPINSSTVINDSKWHNLVYSRSGTVLSYYLDGTLTGRATTTAPTNVLGSKPFKIGRSLPCLSGFRSIAALYDDVRIYHRALNACDVPVLVGGDAGTPATLPTRNGDACTTDSACASGFCTDGVCCNSACGGGAPNDCQACSVAAGAAVNGTCSLRSAGTVCRGAAGACDVAESCTGTSASCPDDGLAAAGTVCRPAANGCDVLESCTGSSVSCPANVFRPDLSLCLGGLLGLPGVCSAGTCVL